MMDYHHGVKVEVIGEGVTLPCYQDPDTESNETERLSRHYIEARTGATFEVKVSLARDFDMQSCDFVDVRASFDGGNSRIYSIAASERNRTSLFTGIRRFCPSTGSWRRSDLSFGELKTSMLSFPAFVPRLALSPL